MGKTLKALAINLALLLFTLGLIEVFCYYAFNLLTPPGSKERLDFALGHAGYSAGTGTLPDGTPVFEIEILPYYLFINKPGSLSQGVVHVDSHGYRGVEVSLERNSKTLRVLAMGGSTTYGYPLPRYQDAWPYQLQEILGKKLKVPVEVINAGVPSALSVESLIAYLLRDRYFQPDIVIIHDGANDVEPMFYADYKPDYSNFHAIEAGGLSLRPGEHILLRSAAMRVFYSWWFRDLSPGHLRPRPAEAVTSKEAARNVKKNEPIGYERYTDLLVNRIKQDGAVPIVFPITCASRQTYEKLPTSMRFLESTFTSMHVGLAKNNQIAEAVAQKYNVPLVKLPPNAVPDDQYVDHCHLKPGGEKIKAELLAATILKILQTHKIPYFEKQ